MEASIFLESENHIVVVVEKIGTKVHVYAEEDPDGCRKVIETEKRLNTDRQYYTSTAPERKYDNLEYLIHILIGRVREDFSKIRKERLSALHEELAATITQLEIPQGWKKVEDYA